VRGVIKTIPTIRALLVGLALALLGVLGAAMMDSHRDMREADRLAAVGRVSVALDKGTVEMSFERSLTQVGLSLPDPFGPPFSELLLQQRERSNAQLDGIASLLASLPREQAEAFRNALGEQRQAVADLRREADRALAKPMAERDPSAAIRIPDALKRTIVLLRETGDLLAPSEGTVPIAELSLAQIADAGWRIREFGGRERTYFAIAALTGAPIPAADLIEAKRDNIRVTDAQRLLVRSLDAGGARLPESVHAAAQAVMAQYFGSYQPVREDFLAQAVLPQPAYPLDFQSFFGKSSAALDTAVGLT
jgi:hypothetical protein